MIEKELDKLYSQIDDMQLKYLEVLKIQIASADSVYDRQQMKDMAELIQLDMHSRSSLEQASPQLPALQISQTAYYGFLENMILILNELSTCSMPEEAAAAFALLGHALQQQQVLDLRDILSCTSITLSVVSLCFTQLSAPNQAAVLARLDQLLQFKKEQLDLLEHTMRTHHPDDPSPLS